MGREGDRLWLLGPSVRLHRHVVAIRCRQDCRALTRHGFQLALMYSSGLVNKKATPEGGLKPTFGHLPA